MQQKLFNLPVLKRCIKCGVEKPANVKYFQKRSDVKDGLISTCKECASQYQKKYYEDNPEKVKARSKKHYEDNPEKYKARHKKWRKANPEKVKAARKKWQKANPEKCRANAKKYQKANPEKVKANDKKWQKANPEKYKAAMKKYRKANPEKCKKYQIDFHKRKLAKFANLFDLSKSDMRMAKTIWSTEIRQAKLCAICNQKAVHAHHIIHASKYPSLSLNPNNGIPLCREHHAEAHLFDPFANLIRKGTRYIT